MNKSMHITNFIAIALVLMLALFMRVWYYQNTHVYYPLSGDAYYYVVYSENLEKYNTFSKQENTTAPAPDSYWAPGYPTFIMLTGKVAGLFNFDSYNTLMLSQIAIGVLIVLLTYLVGALFLARYFAFGAAILTALSPHLISLGNYILTEILFSFCLLLSVYLFACLIKYKKSYFGVLAGIGFAAAYLVNPVVFFAPLFLAVLFYFYLNKIIQAKKLMGYMLFCFALIVLAWSARNYIYVKDSQESVASRAFINLIIGSHHDYHDIRHSNPRDPANPATLDQAAAQGSLRAFLDIFIERVKNNPMDYARWYFIEKPYYLWSWDILVGQGDIHVYDVAYSLYDKSRAALASYSIMKYLHLWLLAFAIFSLIFIIRASPNYKTVISAALYITVIYISGVYVVLQADSRYSVPLRPEMYLCAMFFIENLVAIYRKNKSIETNRRRAI